MQTLAIETSCDDTSIGIISFDNHIFETKKLLAYSQIDDHQNFGGVVPELASRLHSEKIIKVLENIGRNDISKVDFISVTTHPGLPGSLVVGKAVSNLLSTYFNKPIIEVNHIYGHLFSLLLEKDLSEIRFPMVVLTASGGHNDIYVLESSNCNSFEELLNNPSQGNIEIKKIGYTIDDAAGECFDKVSRMLGGPYPGGQWISEKAKNGKENPEIRFKRIFLATEKYEFSFSGAKSQVSGLLKKLKEKNIELTESLISDIAYEFQESVIEVLINKLLKAASQYQAQTIGLAGGVSANDRLFQYINQQTEKKLMNISIVTPAKKVYCTDNAAMIGVAGIIKNLNI